jgi:AcrR family transcriptional regulator
MSGAPDSPLAEAPRSGEPLELPVVEQAPRRRADAQRNEERVLCTARRLFLEHGPENVSMDAVAAAAGVGKGTVFRAFGDRASLMSAILGEDEVRFQEAVIRGEPPLGPGAEPIARITAFGLAYMEHLERHLDIVLAAEMGLGTRFRKGPFQMYRAHMAMLIREALPDVDADYLADVLLAPLAADFFAYQRRVRDRSLEELVAAWEALVQRLLTCR